MEALPGPESLQLRAPPSLQTFKLDPSEGIGSSGKVEGGAPPGHSLVLREELSSSSPSLVQSSALAGDLWPDLGLRPIKIDLSEPAIKFRSKATQSISWLSGNNQLSLGADGLRLRPGRSDQISIKRSQSLTATKTD